MSFVEKYAMHGHVIPSAVKARCGGPELCPICRLEKLALQMWQKREARLPERARRWYPDRMDMLSGAWVRQLEIAEGQMSRKVRS